MEAKGRLTVRHAFVAHGQDLQRLWTILDAQFPSVSVDASCSDGVDRTFDSVEELVTYENPAGRQIMDLTFQARSKDFSRSVSISLEPSIYRTIESRIEGPEDEVMALQARIGEVVESVRPWYAPIARVEFFYVIMTIVAFLFVIAQLMSHGRQSQDMVPLSQAVAAAAILTGVIGALGLIIFALNWLRRRYFPLACFAVGLGLRRYESDEKFRWGMIVAFAVSLFTSLVVAFLLS